MSVMHVAILAILEVILATSPSTQSQEYLAFRKVAADESPVPECLKADAIIQNTILKRYHTIVLVFGTRRKENKEVVMRCLGNSWRTLPLRIGRGVIEVPSGEMIVKFRPATSSDQQAQILRDFNLCTVEAPSDSVPRRFVLRINDARVDPWDVAQRLSRLDEIEYAEPNSIVIKNDSLPNRQSDH